ncbi:MAG: hypothetical protein M3388_04560 [Acidobacteriota bacterium]|nr:hypothetical protein [Acidobacteriota bacterium]
MKNKKFVFLCLIWTLCCGFFGEVEAQEGSVTFKNGITIAVKSETTPADSVNNELTNISNTYSTYSNNSLENTMHRLMTDKKNKLYFGYDLVVTPQSEKNKFKVSIKPLSINPNKLVNVDNFTAQVLPKYPDEMLVDDGDIITLEILENVQTRIKIFDLIKITTENLRGGNYFLERKLARDFTIDDVELQLTNLEAFVNGEKIGKGGGGMSGANVYFYFQGKGRFIMSPFPRQGFNLQKIGVIENNKISFTFNGDNYKFVSTSPVLGTGGKWNLWILHDPEYQSSYTFSPGSTYEFGAADDIKFLFKKQR